MKEGITKRMVEEATWGGNEEFKGAWNHLVYWGESNLHYLNRLWQKSEETNWKQFIMSFAKEI